MWSQQNRENPLDTELEAMCIEAVSHMPMDLGNYEIESVIAEGGMAIVYKASKRGPTGFRKPVALKAMRPDLEGRDGAMLSMFTHEAVLGAMLDHPNLVTVYDFGRIRDQWFIAMEYVEGINLRAAMDAVGGPWPRHLAAYVTLQVARGLAFAHELTDASGRPLTLVHRDVTPKNVLLSTRGEVKLGDFGIVEFSGRQKYTGRGEVRGKLAYLSPEQALGRVLDFRTDIFSLGLVLWEMLAGRPRYDINSPDVYTDVLLGDYMPLNAAGVSVDGTLEKILRRMLARNADDRWDSTRQLVRVLQDYLSGYDASHEIQELVNDVREGRKSVELGVELPTMVNPSGDTREFAKAPVEAGKTVLLEENIPTRLVSSGEMRSVERSMKGTDIHSVNEGSLWHGFVRGMLTGVLVASLGAGGFLLHEYAPWSGRFSSSTSKKVDASGRSSGEDGRKADALGAYQPQKEVTVGISAKNSSNFKELHADTWTTAKRDAVHETKRQDAGRKTSQRPEKSRRKVSKSRISHSQTRRKESAAKFRRDGRSVRTHYASIHHRKRNPQQAGKDEHSLSSAAGITLPPELKPLDYTPPTSAR